MTISLADNRRYIYIVWAMQHLTAFEASLAIFEKHLSVPNWSESRRLLLNQRKTLVEQDEHYAEAAWRLTIGQNIVSFPDGARIFDTATSCYLDKQFNPEVDALNEDVDAALEDDVNDSSLKGASLKTGDRVQLAGQNPSGVSHPPGVSDGDYKVKDGSTTGFLRREKSHANKLTTEQRRENGRKGAAVKKENRMNNIRFEEAKRTRKCQIYALADGQVATFLGARTQIGTAERFGQSEVTAGTCEAYCVFTPDRQLWVYNPSIKKLIRKRF